MTESEKAMLSICFTVSTSIIIMSLGFMLAEIIPFLLNALKNWLKSLKAKYINKNKD